MSSSQADTGHFHCSAEQANLWLRGLLAVAWADGRYDPQEKALIEDLVRLEWPEKTDGKLEPLTPEELGRSLEPQHAEDFLRTAVMTAVADGVYTETEDALLRQFCQALDLEIPELKALGETLISDIGVAAPIEDEQTPGLKSPEVQVDPLKPMRKWMDNIQIHNPKVAHFLCRMIPNQCPFERDVVVFGHKVMHIPPMCKLNPLYEQVVGLRFRALSYLADQGEDVTGYVQG